MCSDISISVKNISKCYQIYNRPSDRLKQFFSSKNKQYYKEFWAVKNASFDIKRGETVGIIGKNGSGKSTLLQMICGTVTPTNGKANISGRIAALLELGAGFNIEFTGIENVFLNAEILGISKNVMKKKLPEILEFSELGDKINYPVKTYSSGMFARLAFSVAIHVNPEILIIDEALAVGDAKFIAKCMNKIKSLQSNGVSILFVSHDIGSVRTLCDRAIWIHEGKIIADGDVFPITGRYMELMLGDEYDEYKESDLTDNSDSDNIDERAVTHWGSNKGLVKNVSIKNGDKDSKQVIQYGEYLNIKIDLSIPKNISRENLSVAISIKNLKGNDLIVATTQEEGISLPSISQFSIDFNLKNILINGQYLLVISVEERHGADVHYYEYIEGAKYFASIANQQYFGIVRPDIEFKINQG